MTEKVSFEQLKLMMTNMQDGQNGQQMTPEERARMFDELKKEKIGEPKKLNTRRSLSQVNLPEKVTRDGKQGSMVETESFQGYDLDDKSGILEPSIKHELEDDRSGLEQSLIIKSPTQYNTINEQTKNKPSLNYEIRDDKSGLDQSAVRHAPVNIREQGTPINVSNSIEENSKIINE